MDSIKLYTLEEAANKLGCTTTWYSQQLRQGRFPGHKIGRTWMLTHEDILTAIHLTAKPAHTIDKKGMTSTSWRKANTNHKQLR